MQADETIAGCKTTVACKVFADELQAVLLPACGADVVRLPAALHTDIGRLEREIEQTLLSYRARGADALFVLYGGTGPPSIDAVLRTYGAVRPEAGNCLDVLLGHLKAEAEAEKAFVLASGWVRAWPSIMADNAW
jgi:hypothetical protein